MPALIKSDEVISQKELSDLVGAEDEFPDLDNYKVIPVCAGEWRRESENSWRFWTDPDFEE